MGGVILLNLREKNVGKLPTIWGVETLCPPGTTGLVYVCVYVRQHMMKIHAAQKPPEVKRGKFDIPALFHKFKPEIIKKCRDSLDTFLWEPILNNMKSNGFIEF